MRGGLPPPCRAAFTDRAGELPGSGEGHPAHIVHQMAVLAASGAKCRPAGWSTARSGPAGWSTPRSRTPIGHTSLIQLTVLGALLLGSGPARALPTGSRLQHLSTVGFGDELTCLGMSHRDPKFVMIGTNRGKLHRTTDGGATWQEITVAPFRDLFFGRERHDDPRLEYALGLPGKSPHLQRWLRSKGLRTSGINLQQLLVQKGDKAVALHWIEVDWHDENRVYIGTIDGLYRSTDKGRTFFRIWQGRSSMAERVINAVATDPFDPKTIMIGTSRGLFISRDRGITFRKEMNFYIRDSHIRGIYFDPQFKGLVHIAMAGAAMASPDSGKNWITTHWDLWAPRSDVQWISLGPNNVRAIGTRDGVFGSWQGGEFGTWKRRGLRMTGHTVMHVMLTDEPNVWYALTEVALWRSIDAGANWKKVKQLGGGEYGRWIHAFEHDEDRLWLLTNRRVYRVGTPAASDTSNRARAMPHNLLDIPPLYLFWRKAMDYKHLYFRDAQDYRDRAPWAALLPTITLGASYKRGREIREVAAAPYIYWPYLYFNAADEQTAGFEVLANWELARLVFDRRELPHFGRVERNMEHLRRDLSERVHRLYADYRRTAHRLVYRPAADPVVREFDRIRLQEIAAFFDAISGGYWSQATGGIP
jgi:photosystem II stability/assembly factor-like uncharacterized protein